MRFASVAALLFIVGCGRSPIQPVAAPRAAPSDEPLRLTAVRNATIFEQGRAEIRIGADGAATVRLFSPDRQDPRASLDFALTASEFRELRELLSESRFFDEWKFVPPPSDVGSWDVTVALGPREKRRPSICGAPEFRSVEQFLRGFVERAEVKDRPRR
jgi:hypothetical protein